jgi:hypothetical protein
MEVGQLLHCDFNIEQMGLKLFFGSLYGTLALLKIFLDFYTSSLAYRMQYDSEE